MDGTIFLAVVTIAYIFLGVVAIAYKLYFKLKKYRQHKYIQDYQFKPQLKSKFNTKHPHLDNRQVELVFEGLRDHFHLYHSSNGHMTSSPSQAVDDAWQDFIQLFQEYHQFCQKAFGYFLYHIPRKVEKSLMENPGRVNHTRQFSDIQQGSFFGTMNYSGGNDYNHHRYGDGSYYGEYSDGCNYFYGDDYNNCSDGFGRGNSIDNGDYGLGNCLDFDLGFDLNFGEGGYGGFSDGGGYGDSGGSCGGSGGSGGG